MNVQLLDLQQQYKAYKKEIDAQIKDVITSGVFIQGEKVSECEKRLAKFAGTKYAIGCSSGTDALLLALMIHDIQPGDEIITTPFSFIAASEVIALLKAVPVFVDIDQRNFNIDPSKIPAAITDKTRGIIAVDMFGQCADYDKINAIAKDRHLFVIEDAAQSFGAQYRGRPACSLTEIACTSFFPAKPLGCYGDGGMVFTDDKSIYNIIRSLRSHGKGATRYDHVRVGLNARLDALQAAVLLAKIKHFPDEIKKRNDAARYYSDHLEPYVQCPKIPAHQVSVFAQYCILVENRDPLQQHLKDRVIPTAIHYPKPLHVQPVFADLRYHEGLYPISEQTCRHILALPLHPFLKKSEQDLVIKCVQSFIKK